MPGMGVLYRIVAFWLAFFVGWTFNAGRVEAKIYSYVDEKGVIHFTNVPVNSSHLKKHSPVKKRKLKRASARRKTRVKRVSYKYSKSYERLLDRYVKKIASYFGVDYRLVKAVIRAESGFNPHAISPKGAIGLMQLMPDTAYEMGIYNPGHPLHNLIGGVRYLKQMLKEFNGNLILALAAYNAGPNAVKKYGGVPPYRETREYIRRVLRYYLHYIRNS